MCDKRIASLKKLALKPPRPIQTVTPEPAVPLQPPGGAPHLLRRKHKVSRCLYVSLYVPEFSYLWFQALSVKSVHFT